MRLFVIYRNDSAGIVALSAHAFKNVLIDALHTFRMRSISLSFPHPNLVATKLNFDWATSTLSSGVRAFPEFHNEPLNDGIVGHRRNYKNPHSGHQLIGQGTGCDLRHAPWWNFMPYSTQHLKERQSSNCSGAFVDPWKVPLEYSFAAKKGVVRKLSLDSKIRPSED